MLTRRAIPKSLHQSALQEPSALALSATASIRGGLFDVGSI